MNRLNPVHLDKQYSAIIHRSKVHISVSEFDLTWLIWFDKVTH